MPLDETDFVDRDYQAARNATAAGGFTNVPSAGPTSPAPVSGARRAPTREELDIQLSATQQQLAKLRDAQEQLERARAAVEDLRRRRADFHRGRDELRDWLAGGVARLEKSELESRRDAEQMSRTLEGLRSAQQSVAALNETQWTEETWDRELGKSLTILDNARMEWNSARLKWPILDGVLPGADKESATPGNLVNELSSLPLGKLFRIGLGLTWPLVVTAIAALAMGLLIWWKR